MQRFLKIVLKFRGRKDAYFKGLAITRGNDFFEYHRDY